MRIAQVSPLYERVPPRRYGGTERVVSYLTEELVCLGHEVTLFASGDSETSAKLVPACPHALWRSEKRGDALPHHLRLLELVFRDPSRFEVIHFHCDLLHFPLLRRQPCPSVTTLHGQLFEADHQPLFAEYNEVPLVSISDNQRTPVPSANWQATIYHGLPRDLHSFNEQAGDYLAFLGRISPEKGLAEAITIAGRTGKKLKIAAAIHPEGERYFQETIEPLLHENAGLVEFVGEVGGAEKDQFLGNAQALLFPIHWPEPFGLVMIESMACGTPVIAYGRGSVREVVEDGRSGFIVEDVDQAVDAVHRLAQLSRHECRRAFEERFDATRMVREYVEVYRRILTSVGKDRAMVRPPHVERFNHVARRIDSLPIERVS